jgi:dienelactone hydrolase
VIDGIKALELLSTHPRIDPKRIGIIGFSRGGQGALVSSYEKVRAASIAGDQKFALHVSFYPGCSQHAKTTGAPIITLMGDKDDYYTVEQCKRNHDRLQNNGANIKMIIYPDARHGFDAPNAGDKYAGMAQHWAKCDYEVDLDTMNIRFKGSSENPTITDLINYLKTCESRGVTVGQDRKAFDQSRKDVELFLKQHLWAKEHHQKGPT